VNIYTRSGRRDGGIAAGVRRTGGRYHRPAPPSPIRNPLGTDTLSVVVAETKVVERGNEYKGPCHAATTYGVQRGAKGTPIVTPRRRLRIVLAGQGLSLLDGG
jgi:hypothetical protein